MSLTLGPKDRLELGDWNVICDVCGFKFKASELRRRWDGYMVCESDYEQRHPQDLLRVQPDKQAPPWSRPQPTVTFTAIPVPADPNSPWAKPPPDGTFVTPAPEDPSRL